MIVRLLIAAIGGGFAGFIFWRVVDLRRLWIEERATMRTISRQVLYEKALGGARKKLGTRRELR